MKKIDIIKAYNEGQKKYKAIDHSSFPHLYEFINNPKYAVVETLEKNGQVRVDFCKKWNFTMLKEQNRIVYLSGIKRYMNKQMLQGYWQEYILEKIKERGDKYEKMGKN